MVGDEAAFEAAGTCARRRRRTKRCCGGAIKARKGEAGGVDGSSFRTFIRYWRSKADLMDVTRSKLALASWNPGKEVGWREPAATARQLAGSVGPVLSGGWVEAMQGTW
jgi:hypothetical protein